MGSDDDFLERIVDTFLWGIAMGSFDTPMKWLSIMVRLTVMFLVDDYAEGILS